MSQIIQNQILNLIPLVNNKKILKAIHTILENEVTSFSLSKQQLDEIDKRDRRYLNNEGTNYNWEEVKSIVKTKK